MPFIKSNLTSYFFVTFIITCVAFGKLASAQVTMYEDEDFEGRVWNITLQNDEQYRSVSLFDTPSWYKKISSLRVSRGHAVLLQSGSSFLTFKFKGSSTGSSAEFGYKDLGDMDDEAVHLIVYTHYKSTGLISGPPGAVFEDNSIVGNGLSKRQFLGEGVYPGALLAKQGFRQLRFPDYSQRGTIVKFHLNDGRIRGLTRTDQVDRYNLEREFGLANIRCFIIEPAPEKPDVIPGLSIPNLAGRWTSVLGNDRDHVELRKDPTGAVRGHFLTKDESGNQVQLYGKIGKNGTVQFRVIGSFLKGSANLTLSKNTKQMSGTFTDILQNKNCNWELTR